MLTRHMNSKWGPLGPTGLLILSKFNFKVDLTSYYKELIELKYSMLNNNETLCAPVYDLLSIAFIPL